MNPSDDPEKPPVIQTAPAKPPLHRHGIGARIRNYFLTGLVVAGPLAITVWLTWSFITWVADVVRPFFPIDYRPETYLPPQMPGTALHLPGTFPGTGLLIPVVALAPLAVLTAHLVSS